MYFVYIIQSINSKKFYIGYTSDLEKRLQNHNSGANRSTSRNKPWKIIYFEKFDDKKSAWQREQKIKKYKGGDAFKKLIKKE